MKKLTTIFATLALLIGTDASAQTFKLGNGGYFNAGGVDVMAFNDYYPEGHQGGICVIMNGNRIATNSEEARRITCTSFWPPGSSWANDIRNDLIYHCKTKPLTIMLDYITFLLKVF